MMTINILTEDNYDFSDHYQYLTNFNSIRRAFDYATNYREDEPLPFTDEDSNKLFEAISINGAECGCFPFLQGGRKS